jgi:pyridoxal 5'-phosphate synthase pdxT subunit
MNVSSTKAIGVLALQGDFREHIRIFGQLGVRAIEVRSAEQLFECNGLVIPGGESTTMSLLLDKLGLREKIRFFWKEKKRAIWGLCAGAILLGKEVWEDGEESTRVESLGLMDLVVDRNSYGRQMESFCYRIREGEFKGFDAVFIRAPQILSVGKRCDVLAMYKMQPIFVRQGRLFASTFHPELTRDSCLHEFFLSVV